MSTVAIAWAVLDSGESATGLGFVFAAGVVPQVVLLPFAGAVADRLGRRRVMLAADVLRCGAQGSLAVALFAGRPALWLFVLLAWLEGTGEAFFTPALDALTVEISPRDQLGNANALYGLAISATRIAGPALGGLLVAVAGPAVVVAADAASYAVSVLALSLLRVPGGNSSARRSLLRDMAEGWAEFRSRTWLWVVTVQFAFFNLITWAPWMLLGPVMGRAYLGGAAVWGLVMAVQGAGAALSGTFFGTAMQQQVPPDMLARVSSHTLFPAYGVGVIGYAIDGPLAAAVGPSAVFGVGAVYGLLSSAAVLDPRSVRAVTWDETGDPAQAARVFSPPRGGRRRRPAGPPP